MTEDAWSACTDPLSMLRFLRGRGHVRKLRLFAVACCRRAWEAYLEPGDSIDMHPAVLASETFADGLIGKKRLRYEHSQIGGVGSYSAKAFIGNAMSAVVHESAMEAAEGAASSTAYCSALLQVGDCLEQPDWKEQLAKARQAEHRVQASLLRDIFGNPFRSVDIDTSWLTPRVLELAQSIYDERTFDQIPILGDALEAAGCDNPDILNHCRGPGPHVRGCWVIDLLLSIV